MSIHGKDVKIFAGNSCPDMAKQIARHLGVPLGKCVVSTFSDGEISVSFQESVRGSEVFLVQSTCAPVNEHLMELLIMIDAAKRASAARITAVIPYFGYARQDRKAKAHDPISAKLVADLITAAAQPGPDHGSARPADSRLFQHSRGSSAGSPDFSAHFTGDFIADGSDVVAVSPDFGFVTRARNFAERCGIPIAIIDKRRQQANVSEVMNIIGDVKGKRVILVDDMIDTAGTLCNGAKAVIERGGAKEVYACATHGVLSGKAMERIEASPIKEIILLDTIPLPPEHQSEKIKVLSVADVFAEAIWRIYTDTPVSPMFL